MLVGQFIWGIIIAIIGFVVVWKSTAKAKVQKTEKPEKEKKPKGTVERGIPAKRTVKGVKK